VLGTFTGFTAPLGVAVDGRRGRIWVADPRASRVTALRRDGTEEFRVSNLTDAGELAVDPTTGEAWVVLGATGSTARLSPAGVVLRVQGGFDFPYAIGIDPGGR
jgi:DNA-binding beta-propeller fold protein YncE